MNHRQSVLIDVGVILAVVATTLACLWDKLVIGQWDVWLLPYYVVTVMWAIAVAGIPAIIVGWLIPLGIGEFRLLWGLQGAFAIVYASVLYWIEHAGESSASGERWDLLVYGVVTVCVWGLAYLAVTIWLVYRAVKSFPHRMGEIFPCVAMLAHSACMLLCALCYFLIPT